MPKENYVTALDNLLRLYNKDREWLSILCNIPVDDINKLLSSKNLTYGQLQDLLMRGGITLKISIQGEQQPIINSDKRLAFLRNNFRLHRNGSMIIGNATGNKNAPDIWWEKDDITMQELNMLEKFFSATYLYTFTGMGNTADVTKSYVNKKSSGVNWKTISETTRERFRENAIKIFKNLSPEERKKLLTKAVLQDGPNPSAADEPKPSLTNEYSEPVKTQGSIPSVANEPGVSLANEYTEPINTDTKKEESTKTYTVSRSKRQAIENTENGTRGGGYKKQGRTAIHFIADEILVSEVEKLHFKLGKTKNELYNESLRLLISKYKDNKINNNTPVSKEEIQALTYEEWLNGQPKYLLNAYEKALKEEGSPWGLTDCPYKEKTILSLQKMTSKEQKDLLIKLAYPLSETHYPEIIFPIATNQETESDIIKYRRIANQISNYYTYVELNLRETIVQHLSGTGNNRKMTLVNPVPSPLNDKEFITEIECVADNDNYLIFHGYEKKWYGKKKWVLSEKNSNDIILFPSVATWYQLAVFAYRHYEENGIKRTRRTISKATNDMKINLDQINNQIDNLKQNFRIIIAELIANGKNEDFIEEGTGKIYSKPEIAEGKASILVTTDSGEKRWNENELSLQELLELAEAMKLHIADKSPA